MDSWDKKLYNWNMFLFVTPPRFKVEAFDWLGIGHMPMSWLPLCRETGNFSLFTFVIKGENSAFWQWHISWGTPSKVKEVWMVNIKMVNLFPLSCIQVLWLIHFALVTLFSIQYHSCVLIHSLITEFLLCTKHSPMLSGSLILFEEVDDKQMNIKSKHSFPRTTWYQPRLPWQSKDQKDWTYWVDHHISQKAQCFQGNVGKIAKSIPLVRMGRCLPGATEKKQILSMSLTEDTSLLRPPLPERQFALNSCQKALSWQHGCLTLLLKMAQLEFLPYNFMMCKLGHVWSLSSRKKCKIGVHPGQKMKLFLPEMLTMKFTSLKTTISMQSEINCICKKFMILCYHLDPNPTRWLSMFQEVKVHFHLLDYACTPILMDLMQL